MNAREWSLRIAELARRENSALADLLLAVAEFDGQEAYRQLGFSSLFDFLHREVGLSRGSAYHRQVGARLVRRFPEVEGPIRDGRSSRRSRSWPRFLRRLRSSNRLDEIGPTPTGAYP
jgi:hypothetical protein